MRFAISSCAPCRSPADGHSLPEQAGGTVERPLGRAVFSSCGRYRWWLARIWQPQAPRLLFLGLNPSRADGRRDDPTLRRLVGFARDWGYGGIEVLNLFARISASPAALRRCEDPQGGRCDAWIRRRLASLAAPTPPDPPATLWLGWGCHGAWGGRDRQLLALAAALGWRPQCLGRTRAGQPRHPLYLPRTGRLEPFAPSCGHELALLPPSSAPAIPAPPWPAPPAATPST